MGIAPMKSYVIIGLGRFGFRLALELSSLGASVLAIDKNEHVIDHIADYVTRAVVADANDKDVLKTLGVVGCDCAVVAHANDLSSSVLATMHLKTLGVKHVICKARDETHRDILERLGADRVIIPEHMVADKIAVNLSSPNVLDLIEVSDDYGIIECITPRMWAGKKLIDIDMRNQYGINLIAIKHANHKIDINLTAETVLPFDGMLVLIGNYESLSKID